MTQVKFPSNDDFAIKYKIDGIPVGPIPNGEEFIDFSLEVGGRTGNLSVHRAHADLALIVVSRFGYASKYEGFWEEHPDWISLRLYFIGDRPERFPYAELLNDLMSVGFRESYGS